MNGVYVGVSVGDYDYKTIVLADIIKQVADSALKSKHNIELSLGGLFVLSRDILKAPIGWGADKKERVLITIEQIDADNFNTKVVYLDDEDWAYYSSAEGGLVLALVRRGEKERTYAFFDWDVFDKTKSGNTIMVI